MLLNVSQNNANNSNNNELPATMTSLKYKPNSSNINHKSNIIHKRTFSQRNSMSLGLTKRKLRSETTRSDIPPF